MRAKDYAAHDRWLVNLQVRKGTPCRIQGFGVVEVLYGKNPRGSGKK